MGWDETVFPRSTNARPNDIKSARAGEHVLVRLPLSSVGKKTFLEEATL